MKNFEVRTLHETLGLLQVKLRHCTRPTGRSSSEYYDFTKVHQFYCLFDKVSSIIRGACTKKLPFVTYHLPDPVRTGLGQLFCFIKFNVWMT